MFLNACGAQIGGSFLNKNRESSFQGFLVLVKFWVYTEFQGIFNSSLLMVENKQ